MRVESAADGGVALSSASAAAPVAAVPVAAATTAPATAVEAPAVPAAVEVLVDESGRLGPLSYLVPAGMCLAAGDAVTVPFGRQVRHGLVLGSASDVSRATKDVAEVLGQRVDPVDLGVAAAVAERHLSSLPAVASRLSPRSGRGAAALDAGVVSLVDRDGDPELPAPAGVWLNRMYLRAPLVPAARLAALEAQRLAASSEGQVLVLCPTVALLEEVLAEFASGVARLDSRARAGAWSGWRSGLVRVGVGTRSSAWFSPARLGGVVVVEEEHPGHVESSAPYTHAREVAFARAAAHGAALTLISANPSAAGMGSRLKVLPVGSTRDWPAVVVVDRTVCPPADRLVPGRLRKALADAERSGMPAVVVAEKRAARRLCVRCGDVRPCGVCQESGCVHVDGDGCGRCGEVGVRWVGWDAGRLAAVLPSAAAVFASDLGRPASAQLVVLFDVDGLFVRASLEPEHEAAALLVRAAEAAGRGGRVVVVTSRPDEPVLALWRSRQQLDLARAVWQRARADGLPPFGRVVTVRCNWKNAPRVDSWPGLVLGPRRRDGEWELLVVCSDEQLEELRPRLARIRGRGKARVWVR